jgi:flagellar hook-length control protein FliK
MQAILNSTVSPLNAPNLAIAPAPPVGSQPAALPFAAVFQDALKGAGNPAKFPPPGKPQDSGREPSTKPLTSFSVPLPPVSVPLTLALTPILTGQQNAAANHSAPGPATSAAQTNAAGTQALQAVPVALPTPLPMPPPAPFLESFSNGSSPERGPEPTRNFAPSGGPVNASAIAPLSNAPTAGIANVGVAGGLAQDPNNFAAIDQNIFSTPEKPTSSDATSQNEAQAQLTPQELGAPAVAASGVPPDAPNQLTGTASVPDFNPASNPTSPATNELVLEPETTSNAAPNIELVSNAFPVPQVDPYAAPSNDSAAPGPRATAPAVPAKQPFENLVAPFPGMTNARISFAASQHSPVRPEIQVQQLPLQPPAIFAASSSKASSLPTDLLTPATAKPAATGAPSFLQSHENPQPPPANLTPAAPVTPSPIKGPGQDHSNEPAGNNSNAKPDHTSAPSDQKTDEKNFVQTLDNTAAASSSNGHSAPIDPAPGAPAPPIQAPVAAPDQRATTNSADSPSAAPLPTPASTHGAPVVNSAHIVDQPGQTEIRIEMQADSLGGVELRAHIAGDQIGASIAVEHHDAQLALAAELPSLHSALAEKSLRVETLSVTQGTFSSLSGGHAQDPGQRGQAQYPAKLPYAELPEPAQPPAFSEIAPESLSAGNPASGLSVVA